MREKIKCLDGPLEDQEVYVDRRLMRLYDEIKVEEEELFYPKKGRPKKRKTGKIYLYMIHNEGLKYVKNSSFNELWNGE